MVSLLRQALVQLFVAVVISVEAHRIHPPSRVERQREAFYVILQNKKKIHVVIIDVTCFTQLVTILRNSLTVERLS